MIEGLFIIGIANLVTQWTNELFQFKAELKVYLSKNGFIANSFNLM
jgi:hypothetical protein